MLRRGLATLVRAEVVMTGTQLQLHSSILPGAALPTPDMPSPALARNIGAEEMEYSSTWSDRIQVYADAKKNDVLRRIHNAINVEIRSIL